MHDNKLKHGFGISPSGFGREAVTYQLCHQVAVWGIVKYIHTNPVSSSSSRGTSSTSALLFPVTCSRRKLKFLFRRESLSLSCPIYIFYTARKGDLRTVRGGQRKHWMLNQTWLPEQRKSQRGCKEFNSFLLLSLTRSVLKARILALLHVFRFLFLAPLPLLTLLSPICNLFKSDLSCFSTRQQIHFCWVIQLILLTGQRLLHITVYPQYRALRRIATRFQLVM